MATGDNISGILQGVGNQTIDPRDVAARNQALQTLFSQPSSAQSAPVQYSYDSSGNPVSGTLPNSISPAGTGTQSGSDFRVRISPVNNSFYGSSGILQPLLTTNGVLFPYTPQITFEQTVDYQTTNMIHTNMDYNVYQRTPSVNINITGKFSIQNQNDGRYALAALHFFRVASKMYFGIASQLAGTNGLPPPLLRLTGYGTYMFGTLNSMSGAMGGGLNCILKTHSFTYPEQIDTVTITGINGGGSVRLPAIFDLQVGLTVQQTPAKMRDQFDLEKFRTGALMQGGGWI